jgi:hypothetical protein
MSLVNSKLSLFFLDLEWYHLNNFLHNFLLSLQFLKRLNDTILLFIAIFSLLTLINNSKL